MRCSVKSSFQFIPSALVLGFILSTLSATNLFAACVTPPTGLVGWWAGDGNTLDRVETNHGTAAGNWYFRLAGYRTRTSAGR